MNIPPFVRATLALALFLTAFAPSAFGADLIKPTLVISAPVRASHTTNQTITVRGTARDNIRVASVELRVENSASNFVYATATGSTNWTNIVILAPGLNTLRARAYDVNTNRSVDVTTTVYYDLYQPITLSADFGGKITGATNNQKLLVAKSYTLTATPSAGYVFLGWTNSAGLVTSTKTTLPFVMPIHGMAVHAKFGPATFNGLFRAREIQNVSVTNCGFFNVTRTVSGLVSGKIMMQGSTYYFSGKQLTNSTTAFFIPRAGKATLLIGFTIEGVVVRGSLTDGAFDSQLEAQAPLPAVNAWAGVYNTVVGLPVEISPLIAPDGYGVLTVRITGGTAAISGTLQDGTSISTSSPLFIEDVNTINGDSRIIASIYVPLQSGKGMLHSFMIFQRGGSPQYFVILDAGIGFWQKAPAPADKLYKNGFTAQVKFLGAKYVAPALNQTVLGTTNAFIEVFNGNIGPLGGLTNFSKLVNLTRTKAIVHDTNSAPGTPTAIALNAHININPATGVVTGDFKSPGTGLLTKINAITVQFPGLTAIRGYYLGTNQSGSFSIEGD